MVNLFLLFRINMPVRLICSELFIIGLHDELRKHLVTEN